MLAGSTLGAYSLYKSSLFNLEKVNYTYTELSEQEQAAHSAYLEFLKPEIEKKVSKQIGKSLWELDIFAIEKDLEKFPWIKNVVITRQFPSDINIDIEPKKIVANIMKSPSKVQPVAYDSSLLSDVEITKAPSVPILSGNAFARSDDLRKKALDLLHELPREGAFSYDQVSEIYPFRDDRKNDEFQVLMKNTKALVLINTENVPLKAARISRVIEYMDPAEMKGRVIDSNFSKKVLVRPRNHR